jgi:hypothetical protein
LGALRLWVAEAAPGRAQLAAALASAAVTAAPAGGARAAAAPAGPSLASIHVRSDDTAFVEKTLRQTLPRLGRSAGSAYLPPRDGWIAVYDDLCDTDRKAQWRLAEELSVRLGLVVIALAVEAGAVVRMLVFDRGRMVDEYLSVPEWYGPLPPGEALALGINPTLVSRLSGADPGALRAIARTAASPAELPPPDELVADLGSLLGLHGAAAGFEIGAATPEAVRVTHG